MERRPLRICAIGSSTSSHVASRVKRFADRGHHVFLISDTRSGLDGVTELVPSARPIRGLRSLSLLLSVPKLIRECRPDVIHVHFAYSPFAWMAMVADRHPLVVSVMGGDILFEEQGSPTASGRRLTRRLLESADLITSKSAFLIDVLDRLGGFGAKAMKVVWGVDLKHFRRVDAGRLRTTLGLRREDRVILSPRILQRFYNVHLIVEAMPRIAASVPGSRLLITEYQADLAYRDEILRRVRALGLEDCIQFVGHVPYADMPQYYSLADVAVGVPPSDGLPQTLLEAMACGAPSIVSRLSRYEELVTHGESAYFVDLTPESIADGVIRVLRDAALRERVASMGREIVATHADFDRDVDRVETKYYELSTAGERRRVRYGRRAGILVDVARHLATRR
jgi:glycosyltransferase involved in cell wall biosynthesis